MRTSVAIENNIVYFISNDGIFYALNLLTGKLNWIFTTEGEKMYDSWDYYTSSPAVSNGIVYFGCGDRYVYALNGNSGSLI
ncbi:MAG: PQQ-like beta-propeller repeat protein [Bacteroidetes bacterium]|nr:PQQ-like beta-propeller repeat protein [Bacteroidota bacterium]